MPSYDSARINTKRQPVWLLGLLLLLAQASLLVHQIEHDSLTPHTACVLCAHADHLGDATPAAPMATPDMGPAEPPLPSTRFTFQLIARAPKPPTRAPPLPS